VVTGKDLLHLIRGELVPLDMDDVVIVPLKAENNHNAIVSGCIYETLHGAQAPTGWRRGISPPTCELSIHPARAPAPPGLVRFVAETLVRSTARKLPEDLLEESGRSSDTLRVSRAERLAEISRRVREESLKVNADFAAIERDPDEARD
jgi:hypothetical protein